MPRRRHTGDQGIGIPKEADAGFAIDELYCKYGISSVDHSG